MKKIGSIFRLDFVPSSADAGLLVLRLWFGLSMLVLHGWAKLMGFSQMAGKFPDPLKIGHRNSLMLAILGEVVCPALVALGLFTRFGALGSAIQMTVAFFLVHKGVLKAGPGSGELAFLYLAGFATIFVAGAGKFALDSKGITSSSPKRPKPAKE